MVNGVASMLVTGGLGLIGIAQSSNSNLKCSERAKKILFRGGGSLLAFGTLPSLAYSVYQTNKLWAIEAQIKRHENRDGKCEGIESF